MRALIGWEIWQRRASFFFWSLGTTIYIVLVTAVFQNFVNNQTVNLGRTVESLPAAVKSFVSINSSFTTPAGYLGSEPYYVVLPIIFLILAISLGSRLLANEEANGTLELILSRSVSRGKLLTAKALAGILLLAAVDAVAGGAMTLFTFVFRVHIGIVQIWQAQLLLFLLALLFGGLAYMLSAIGRAGRSAAMGISMLLAIGGYVLTSLGSVVHWLSWPARLLPYHYYEPSKVLNGHFTGHPAAGYLLGVIVFGFIAWLAFRRRDIS